MGIEEMQQRFQDLATEAEEGLPQLRRLSNLIRNELENGKLNKTEVGIDYILGKFILGTGTSVTQIYNFLDRTIKLESNYEKPQEEEILNDMSENLGYFLEDDFTLRRLGKKIFIAPRSPH